jgi:hypothetical protein
MSLQDLPPHLIDKIYGYAHSQKWKTIIEKTHKVLLSHMHQLYDIEVDCGLYSPRLEISVYLHKTS